MIWKQYSVYFTLTTFGKELLFLAKKINKKNRNFKNAIRKKAIIQSYEEHVQTGKCKY